MTALELGETPAMHRLRHQVHVHVPTLCDVLATPPSLRRYTQLTSTFLAQQSNDNDSEDQDLELDVDLELELDSRSGVAPSSTGAYTLTYGELTDLAVLKFVEWVKLTANDTLVDVGSGE